MIFSLKGRCRGIAEAYELADDDVEAAVRFESRLRTSTSAATPSAACYSLALAALRRDLRTPPPACQESSA